MTNERVGGWRASKATRERALGVALALLATLNLGGLRALASDAPAPIPRPAKPVPAPELSKTDAVPAVVRTKPLSEDDLERLWRTQLADAGFSALHQELSEREFSRIPKAAYGFSGTLSYREGPAEKSIPVQFTAYDFHKPALAKERTWQTATLLWGRVGDRSYQAYTVLPKGSTMKEQDGSDFLDALGRSDERYWDAGEAKVLQARSFGKRLRECIRGGRHGVVVAGPLGLRFSVQADCTTMCLSAVVACGGATALLASVGLGMTVPAAIAVFAVCAGGVCVSCLAICALASLVP